jgi:endonuclease III
VKEFSPYMLLQEILWPDRWKSTVACILLNRTKRAQVDKVWPELFKVASTPEKLLEIEEEKLIALLKPLGFSKMRAKRLRKMSEEWLRGIEFKNLCGVGEYAIHSDQIFYQNVIPESVSDHALTSYVEWKKKKD